MIYNLAESGQHVVLKCVESTGTCLGHLLSWISGPQLSSWEQALSLLGRSPCPQESCPGNHGHGQLHPVSCWAGVVFASVASGSAAASAVKTFVELCEPLVPESKGRKGCSLKSHGCEAVNAKHGSCVLRGNITALFSLSAFFRRAVWALCLVNLGVNSNQKCEKVGTLIKCHGDPSIRMPGSRSSKQEHDMFDHREQL